VVAAEAFTSSAAERWQAHPASMKALGDWAFCAGVNRIVFHRYQHQPWLDRRPGMTMGPYGVHWERTQTWWEMVPAYHAYLSRCQFMLRRGLPVADVLYLAAEGAPHVFRAPASATRCNPPDRLGYNFDGIAPETLLARVSVKDGRLMLPDGMSYRVLVLPERDTMTPALLHKVRDLVEAGATVIGPRALKSPSLSGYPKCDEEVKNLAREMWGEVGVPASAGRDSEPPKGWTPTVDRRIGSGHIVWRRGSQSDLPKQSENLLEHAKWIWHKEAKPGLNAPVGKRVFRRAVTVDSTAGIQSARVFMTADNAFELTVNGRSAAAGDNFHNLCELDVVPMLKPGENVLSVIAENGGDAPNPAGLIGALVIKFRDGRVLDVPTDQQWQSAPTAEAGVWTPALELGPVGMAPWKLSGKPTPREPEQYGDFAVVADVLKKMRVTPDFESDAPLRHTHRRDGATDIYFVANPEDRDVKATCMFRVSGRQPELWDPVTGATRALAGAREQDGRTVVPLEFAPHQSWFVVFRNSSRLAPRDAGTTNVLSRSERTAFGPWEVQFDPKWGGPAKPVTFDKLEDWSKHSDPGIRYYSGTATYRTTFEFKIQNSKSKTYLDLGVVKNLARVRLNGRDLGVVWCAPWRVEISGAVKERDNCLEITVANLWPNRLIGDQSLPLEKRFTWTTWNPFKQDALLLESGLLGPVTLWATEPQERRKP
ncbi:MAG: glycosyl hydrolase, partial [Verrucomicrobia bacterium]|nr:glycosyl hydrolase [Verrucomicrobiota bacterium]